MQPEDQGSRQDRYTLVARTLVFVTRTHPLPDCDGEQEQILLLKGASDKRLWAGKYNGVGGHLEPGESPEASARRELREETGIEVAHLKLCGVVHITMPDPPGIILFVFLGEGPRGSLHPSEEGVPVWVDSDRLSELPLVEDLSELLPKLLAAQAEKRTLYGIYHITDAGLQMTFSYAG